MRRKPVFKKICLLLAAVMLMSMMPVDLFALAVEDMGEPVVDEVLVREEAPSEGANITTQPEATTLAPESPGEEIIPPADPQGAAQGEEEASEPAPEGEDAEEQTPATPEEQPQTEQGETEEGEPSEGDAGIDDATGWVGRIAVQDSLSGVENGIVPFGAGIYVTMNDQSFTYTPGAIDFELSFHQDCSVEYYFNRGFFRSVHYQGYGNDTISIQGPDVGVHTIVAQVYPWGSNQPLLESISATLIITQATLADINFPTPSDITYGQTIGESTLSGGSTDLGTFDWVTPNWQPLAAMAYSDDNTAVIFTPSAATLKNYDLSSVPDWDPINQTVRRVVSISVNKAPNNLSVTCDNVTYGQEPNPQISNPNGGAETIEYKAQGADDSTYIPTKPTNAGTYTVRVTSAATAYYAEATDTDDFEIGKAPNNLSVTCGNVTYGQEPNPQVINLSGGAVTTEYKAQDAGDSTYIPTKPTDAGFYTVRVTSAATQNYEEATATDDFEIGKADNNLSVTCGNVTYGQEPNPQVINLSGGAVTTEYKGQGADDSTYTAAKPTNAGQYTVRVISAATDNYEEATATDDFEIGKAPNNLSVACDDVNYGQEPNPQVINPSGGAETIEYKAQGADDSTYTAEKPTNAGQYTVRVISAATDNYEEATATDDFTISPATPTITPPSVASAVGKGSLLSQIILLGGRATGLGGQAIGGRFVWKSPQTAINASGNYAVLFVPDSANYSTVECSVAVEVDTTGPTILSLSATPVGSNEAVLEVVAMDDAMPLTYQWQVMGSWIDIPGATSARFDYQGMNANQEYTVRVLVTDAHGNIAISPEIIFKTGAAVIANLPGSYTLIKSQSVSFTPAPSGGAWSYDEKYLSMRQDGEKTTFTALKTGKTSATYTVGGTQHVVMMTINASTIPQTGDTDSAIPYAALCLALLLTVGIGIVRKRRKHA
jgi:LPXTG-motif cell wall-anchored protein